MRTRHSRESATHRHSRESGNLDHVALPHLHNSPRARLAASVTLALLAITGCNGGKSPGVAGECEAATDCDAAAASRGHLCLAGRCAACAETVECRRVTYYGDATACVDGRCAAIPSTCVAGALGCPCQPQDACSTGFVCDSTSLLCRQPHGCAQIPCGAHQLCGPPDLGKDATCLADCDPGFLWNTGTSACDAVVANCTAGDPGSIKAQCDTQHRDCIASGAGAQCGACAAGYEEVGGVCVELCVALDCGSLNRACQVSGDTANCTTCLAGYIEGTTPGGACVLPVTCASLGCSGDRCVNPPGQAARCLEGSQEVCDLGPICPPGQAWEPASAMRQGSCVTNCAACPTATAGYTGELYPVTTAGGICVCVPQPGYFFASGGSITNRTCDADIDGWVRSDARGSIKSADCAVRNNAKCTVRTIDRFVLEGDDEPGAIHPVRIADDPVVSSLPAVVAAAGVLELYEPDANDTFSVRVVGTDYPPLPPYNPASLPNPTRMFFAQEINSLTKACAPANNQDPSGDYNANRIPDIVEWHGMQAPATVPDWLQPFMHYSYWLELYEGYYVAPAQAGQPGSYYIAEKSRGAQHTEQAQPLVSSETGGTWRACYRRTDADYTPSPTAQTPNIGMDFARFNQQQGGYGVPVMGHASQFKCVSIVADMDLGMPEERRQVPYKITRSEATADYFANACRVDVNTDPDSVPTGSLAGGTTWSPRLDCNSAILNNVTVTLAVAKYQDYAETPAYERSCINACVDQGYLPPNQHCTGWPSSQSSCTWNSTTGARTGCFYNAGCANCTWTVTAWSCAAKSSTICGGCGTCTNATTNPLAPVWECRASEALCTGNCDECLGDTDGRYQCRGTTTAAACGPDCGACTRQSDTNYTCAYNVAACGSNNGNPDCGAWGACGSFGSECGETGIQQRSCTYWACSATTGGACQGTPTIERQACTRSTAGNLCGQKRDLCDAWSTCTYSSTCDEVASQSRTCHRDQCSAGVCGVTNRNESQTCGTRSTNGIRCSSESCGGLCDRPLCCQAGSCSNPCGSCVCEPCPSCFVTPAEQP